MTRFPLLIITCVTLLSLNAVPTVSAAEPASPVYEYKDLDFKPTLKRPVRIHYPFGMRKKGEAVEIVLRFVVTKKGEVTRIMIVRATHPDMIVAAMETYERAKFTPGMKDGNFVDAWVEVTDSLPAK